MVDISTPWTICRRPHSSRLSCHSFPSGTDNNNTEAGHDDDDAAFLHFFRGTSWSYLRRQVHVRYSVSVINRTGCIQPGFSSWCQVHAARGKSELNDVNSLRVRKCNRSWISRVVGRFQIIWHFLICWSALPPLPDRPASIFSFPTFSFLSYRKTPEQTMAMEWILPRLLSRWPPFRPFVPSLRVPEDRDVNLVI